MLAAVLRKHPLIVLATALLVLGLGATACDARDFALSDFTPTDLTPQMTLKTFCAAFKARDYPTVYDQFAADSSIRGMKEADFASALQDNIDERSGVTDCSVRNVQVSGSRASGIVTFTYGGSALEMDYCALINVNGMWKIMYMRPWSPEFQ